MPEFSGWDLDSNEEGDAESEDVTEEFRAEQDALNESDEFFQTYGFEHVCRCADDWDEGNLGVVSVCYLNMCSDGMEHLKEANTEVRELKAKNAQMRIQLIEAGVDPDA